MSDPSFPRKQDLTIQFAHPAYAFADTFGPRSDGISFFQTRTLDEALARVSEADILVISGLWRPEFLERADKLRFVQVLSVGYEQFDLDALRSRGIHMANASGVNRNAVSEQAMALLLAMTRHLPQARDNQHKRHWRGMISDIAAREQEVGGKTLVIYGLGDIGARISRLARAFGMRVIGIKRDVTRHDGSADEVRPPEAFLGTLPEADFVVLACPLTDQTRGLIGPNELAAMPAHARLINVARGGCVDEDALIEALQSGGIAGAGLDTTAEEPLPEDSPLWAMQNVLVTPHSAGETERYEQNLFDILLENIDRLQRGAFPLLNQKT